MNNAGKYKLLLSIFKHAVMWKVIRSEDNPMENQPVPKPLHRQQNKDFYRSHEIPVMLELLKDREEKNQLIVLLALTGALRRGEIAGLTTDMIDFKNNRIHIKYSLQYSKRNGLKLKSTKASEERIVTFPEKFMKRLHKHYLKVLNLKMEMGSLWKGFKDVNGKEVIMLFSNKYGIPQRPDSITQFWNRFTLKNEDVLRRIRFHDLRHSSATFILNEGSKKGLNIKTVQKRLGHTDIKTTLRLYSHVSEDDDVTAGDLFEKFL